MAKNSKNRHEKNAWEKEVINHLHDGIITIDSHGNIESFNPAAEKIFGYRSSEVVGRNVNMLADQPHRDNHDSYIDRFLKTGEKKIIGIGRKVQGKRKNGSIVPIELAVTEMTVGEERKFVGILRDITERELLELEINKLSRAVEQSANIVVITSTKGIIEYVNPKFTEITGYSSDEVIGQNPGMLSSGQTSAPEYEELWQTISSGKEWRGEFFNRRKDNSLYQVAAAISPVKDDDGKIVNYLAIEEDITERKEAQKKLAKQNQLLLELSAPVLKVLDNVVLLPLIGAVDEKRANLMIESLLGAIVKNEAKVAIIDVTGASMIDTYVARRLMDMIAAAELLGTKVLITGIVPEVSYTLVKLGVDISNLRACGSLSAGIIRASKYTA